MRLEDADDLQHRALEGILRGATSEELLDLQLHRTIREIAEEKGIPWEWVSS